jgi:hypothetical protein
MSPVGFSFALNHEGFESGAGMSRDQRLAFDLRRPAGNRCYSGKSVR